MQREAHGATHPRSRAHELCGNEDRRSDRMPRRRVPRRIRPRAEELTEESRTLVQRAAENAAQFPHKGESTTSMRPLSAWSHFEAAGSDPGRGHVRSRAKAAIRCRSTFGEPEPNYVIANPSAGELPDRRHAANGTQYPRAGPPNPATAAIPGHSVNDAGVGGTRPALDMRAGWRGETPTRAFWTTCGRPESRVAPH